MSGERVGLVGRNGTGKTTLFKLITGEETLDRGDIGIRKGAVIGYLEQIPKIPSVELTAGELLYEAFSEVKKISRCMRSLEQQMADNLEASKLHELMEEYADMQNQFIALDGYSVEERLQRIVQGFGLKPLLEKPFSVLSGGEKTIVKLARTILEAPDILLLDEPTNHLDLSTTMWLEDYLERYPGTVLIISHDRRFLDRVTNKTVFLEGGQAVAFNGNYSFSLEEQRRLLLLEFEAYKNQQKKIDAMKAAIKRFREWGARNPDNPR